VLKVYDKMGINLGAYYSNELKLKNLNKQSSTYDYATVLFPIGKDGLTIANINNGKSYIENFTYTDKYIEKIWINEDYDVAERLKAAAEIYLDSIA
jgi:phage minor structural protein